jgi:hypothetical protein
MQQRPESTRIALDLREVRDRWRGWILGFVGAAGARVELRPTGGGGRVAPRAAPTRPALLRGSSFGSMSEVAECTCLDDCPRDHPNE